MFYVIHSKAKILFTNFDPIGGNEEAVSGVVITKRTYEVPQIFQGVSHIFHLRIVFGSRLEDLIHQEHFR